MDITSVTSILSDLGFLGMCAILLFVIFKLIDKHDTRERDMLEKLSSIELKHTNAENKMVSAIENNTRVMEAFLNTISKGDKNG